MIYDAIIIGAGLAGSSAAIRLAGAGRHVLLLEKHRYPVHKLCGEFLSVEVGEAFARLGVLEAVRRAGATSIDAALVTTADGAVLREPLPGTALGLSRYRLDPLLFAHARARGADAREGMTVRDVQGDLERGFTVEAGGASFRGRVVLGAYGKRGRLDGRLARPFLRERTPFVAFKAHYEGVDLGGVIELHAFDGGYCGLLQVEAGRVNACWISHERLLKAAGRDPDRMAAEALAQNPVLAERFGAMRRVSERFEAVSQVSFARKGTFVRDICMIGDTAAMIAPLCGDGMAMALRSAELAAGPVDGFLEGTLAAQELRDAYTAAWEDDFGTRLRLGRWVHHGLTRPRLAGLGLRLCRVLPGLGGWLIRHTRG